MTKDKFGWEKFFPFKDIREQQAIALNNLCNDVINGKRIHLAELGTGVGKSAIAVTFSKWLNEYENPPDGFNCGATILTSQRILQDQYLKDFSFAKDIRSSTNFECSNKKLGPTCAITMRINRIKKRAGCSQCAYRTAKDIFAASKLGVTNYSYFLSESEYAGELPKKHLLVLDEAHNIEDEVRKWASLEITENEIEKLDLEIDFSVTDVSKHILWLTTTYRDQLAKKLIEIQNEILDDDLDESMLLTLGEKNEELDKRLCQVNRIINSNQKIMVTCDAEKRTLLFQPLDVSSLTENMLYNKAAHILMMTATVLDKNVFKRNIGLPDDIGFMSIQTPFKSKSFGINLMPVGKLSRKTFDEAAANIPGVINKILNFHKNEKGIIHTVNYDITKKIMEIKNPRLLIQEEASDREEIINLHMKSSTPTVIVSPGMTEGIDLKDDLARFQVLIKVPYPSLTDEVVKEKMKVDREWYAWRTIRALSQAIGRGVRSENDYVKTYILDECYIDLLDRWGYMFPKHIVENIDLIDPNE